MSQPRQATPHSSSPPSRSKSSLWRTSGPQHATSSITAAHGLRASPQPQVEDDPIVASHQPPYSRQQLILESEYEHEHEPALESEHYGHGHSTTIPITIPSFQPFFTLIEDSVTNEHYHPTVHYVFADDDSDIIAEAACRSLEALDPSQRPTSQTQTQTQTQTQPRVRALSHKEEGEGEGEGDLDDADDNDDATNPRLPPPIAGVREHYLVLDVQPRTRPHPPPHHPQLQLQSQSHSRSQSYDESVPPTTKPAYEVVSAQSLSADWQVLRSTVTTAPTIGDGGGDGAAADEDDGFMLRIEGKGNTPGEFVSGGVKESMEEMIDRFQRRLEDIRQVMELTTTGPATVTATHPTATLGGTSGTTVAAAATVTIPGASGGDEST